MKNSREFQQGDVLINRIDSLPEGIKKVERKVRGFVLAEGETTGHAHVIDEDIEMYEKEGNFYIRVRGGTATVTHEEHAPIEIPSGLYEIGIVQEVDPWTEQPRKVVD
jgi:hypothetical protein